MGEPALRLSLDVSAVPARPVGAGQYTVELVRALCSRQDVEPLLVGRRSDRNRWEAYGPRGGLLAVAPDARPLRLVWEQVRLPSVVDRSGADVHHGPHYTMPEHARVPVVVTVHDLSFFEAPRWHERTKVPVFRRAIRVAARRASAIVCPSRFTADELARWCRVEGRVFVAPHGVDPARFLPEEPSTGADAACLRPLAPRLVERPFVLFVGTIEPRKDVVTLVEAFARIAPRHPDVSLVLAGTPGWGAQEVERSIAVSGLGPRVVRTGYVPDEAVPALLRSAAVVAYPARYEGFGLPALEALACGAPLVTTAGTAMAETAAGAADLVAPGDPDDLAAALDAVLAGRPAGDRRRERGLEIAARHRWETSAARHLDAYRFAAGRDPGTRAVERTTSR